MRKFNNLKLLQSAVESDDNFTHQIKGKRIRKQLSNLLQTQDALQNIHYEQFQLDSFGITFRIRVLTKDVKARIELKIDYEYPFNRPRVELLEHNDFGQGRDLLKTILGLQGQWGPSMMLSQIIEKLPELVKTIHKYPQHVLWEYRIEEEYCKTDLEMKGVTFFKIDMYSWRFMVKSTKKIIIGLTKDVLLLFEEKSEDHLLLFDWVSIQNIKQAKTIIKERNIQLILNDGRKNPKIYLGGSEEIENILEYLDPIQMAERRITISEKTGKFNQATVVSDYSKLIEHYSLIDIAKSQAYMESMKKIIAAQYGGESNKNEVRQMREQEN